jgi:hypothetical protein
LGAACIDAIVSLLVLWCPSSAYAEALATKGLVRLSDLYGVARHFAKQSIQASDSKQSGGGRASSGLCQASE